MITHQHTTREAWLKAAVEELSPMFEGKGTQMPEKWAVSVGFPKGAFKNQPSIGECWDPSVSDNNITNMFISPVMDDLHQILGVLLHEMVHAAVGLKCKHTGEFRRVARALGLEGKLTATFVSEGTDLYKDFTAIIERLGAYPGTAMKVKRAEKKAKWFLVKLASKNDPGYKFTIAPRLLEEFGMPKDYLGDDMEIVG